nr:cytochrome p450 3a12 [Quercus suber]
MALLSIFCASFGFSSVVQRYAPRYFLGFPWTALVLFFFQACLYMLYSFIIYPRFVSPLRHLPTPKEGDFILGQTRQIVRESSGNPQRNWLATVPNDGVVRYSVWGRERIMTTNPKAMAEVLVTKNYDFVKPWQIRAGLGQILGIGILLAEGDEHKRQRKHLMPAFAFRHVKDLYPTFWAKSREMVQCLAKAAQETKPTISEPVSAGTEPVVHAPGTINVADWTSRATLDIIGLTGMGEDFDSLQNPDNQLNQTYRNVFSPGRAGRWLRILGVFLPFWFLRRIPVQRNWDLQNAQAYIKKVCRDAISRKRKVLAEKQKMDVDIMSIAIESGGFSDEDLVNQMMTFLAAGHETTATAMIWAIYLLCKHPEIQAKLRTEVHASIPSLDSSVTAAQIDNCHYLSAFCSEVLRLWAPVAITIRVADKDTTVCGHFIPKGTTVVLPPWAINVSTELWGADAETFRPERWLDADGKANNNGGADSNYSFLTFLHGPRSCIGQKFAQAEFACLVAGWVGRFETVFEQGSALATGPPEIKGEITAKPKVGLWVNLKEVEGLVEGTFALDALLERTLWCLRATCKCHEELCGGRVMNPSHIIIYAITLLRHF